MFVRRDGLGSGAFGFGQESCVILGSSQSGTVTRLTTSLLEVSDATSEQDDAVDGTERICEGVGPVTV